MDGDLDEESLPLLGGDDDDEDDGESDDKMMEERSKINKSKADAISSTLEV